VRKFWGAAHVLIGVSPWLSDVFLRSQSDERLVALARAGHERAFVAIVERYRRELVAQARRLDSSGRAEDIVQQTFLSAFAALQSGAEVAHLRGWLYQIVRHAAIRANTRERPITELDSSLSATESLEDAVESRLQARNLLAELARLPNRQRDAIVEISIAGRSRAEVASSMGLTEGAVRQLVHRARTTLRTAATALAPFPLVKLLSVARGAASTEGTSDIAIGAGTASAGGAMLKLGALVATGVAATAVVASRPAAHHPRRASSERIVRIVAAPRRSSQNAQPALLASSTTSIGSSGQSELVGSSSNSRPQSAGSGGRAGRGSTHSQPSHGRGGLHGSPSSSGPSDGGGDSSGSGSSHGGSGGSDQGGSSGGDGGQQSSGGSGSGDGSGQAPSTNGGGTSQGSGSSSSGSSSDGGSQTGGGSGSSDGGGSGGGGSSSGSGSSSTTTTTTSTTTTTTTATTVPVARDGGSGGGD
jgi:RNA polymerase sigma factor (sigma-70 family)